MHRHKNIRTQHNTTHHSTTQHNTTQYNTTQHNTTHHITTQNNKTKQIITQHNKSQQITTQHNTTRHNKFQNLCIGIIDCRTFKCAGNNEARVLWCVVLWYEWKLIKWHTNQFQRVHTSNLAGALPWIWGAGESELTKSQSEFCGKIEILHTWQNRIFPSPSSSLQSLHIVYTFTPALNGFFFTPVHISYYFLVLGLNRRLNLPFVMFKHFMKAGQILVPEQSIFQIRFFCHLIGSNWTRNQRMMIAIIAVCTPSGMFLVVCLFVYLFTESATGHTRVRTQIQTHARRHTYTHTHTHTHTHTYIHTHTFGGLCEIALL